MQHVGLVPVGTALAGGPLGRSGRAELPNPALTSGGYRGIARLGKEAGFGEMVSSDRRASQSVSSACDGVDFDVGAPTASSAPLQCGTPRETARKLAGGFWTGRPNCQVISGFSLASCLPAQAWEVFRVDRTSRMPVSRGSCGGPGTRLTANSISRPSQRHRYAWERAPPERRWAPSRTSRPHAHQLFNPFDLADFDLDSALPARAALEIVYSRGLAANDQSSVIGLPQPIIEAGHGNAQTTRGFLG